MKVPTIMILIFMICGLGSFMVADSTDSCASNLDLSGLGFGFDTTSLTCISAWSAHNYVLRYSQSGPTTWSFVLSVPTVDAFVAIGFSSDGAMVGSSAVVGWIPSSGGGGIIKQYKLDGTSSSRVKPDQGDLILNSSATIVAQSGRTFLAFQLITAEQPKSQIIYALGPPSFLPTAPGYALTEHQDKVATSVNYVSGQTKTTKTPHSKLRKSHGFLNIVSWGFLIIIGAMVARHCREWDPQWFYSHAVIQSMAYILGLIAIILGLVLENRTGADVSTHKGIGIFVLVLASLQLTAFLARPDKESKARKYWNWYHHFAGRILFIFAVANIFYGIHLGEKGNGWRVGYGVVLALLVAASIVLEIRLFRRK